MFVLKEPWLTDTHGYCPWGVHSLKVSPPGPEIEAMSGENIPLPAETVSGLQLLVRLSKQFRGR